MLAAGAMLGIGGCALFSSNPNIMLSGQEEVPAVASTAFGMGRILVGQDGRVSGNIRVLGVEATAAHIHVGALGKIGPPIVTLTKISGKVWSVPMNTVLSDGQLDSYRAGALYINVHSLRYKSGEIRGQLRPGS
jgi:hypothetical protein